VPFADTSVYRVPETLTDEQVLFLADILPTALEVGVLNGGVQFGDTVAIIGACPIGLATILDAGADHRDRPRRRTARAGARVRRRRHSPQWR
jgi:threonine dehydrogenase-like Zn-dependent dehydrogenase